MRKFFSILFIFYISFFITGYAQPKKLTVKDVAQGHTFRSRTFSDSKWTAGGNKFSYVKQNAIYEQDILTGTEREIVSGKYLESHGRSTFSISNYMWSPDEKYLLFSGKLPARAMKSGGSFYIIDANDKSEILFVESEQEQVNIGFSPDSKKIGFVRGNNLFVIDIKSGKETQLTFDGSENILNGKFDWVYEEEFSIIRGWEWSPDSRSIAFWRMDQTNVPEIHIAEWDSVNLNFIEMKYPKSGYPNSEVRIGVVDAENPSGIKWMDLGSEKDIYVPRIHFTKDPQKLVVQRLNRAQNNLDVLFYDITTGKPKTVLNEISDTWIDIYDDITFFDKSFIWTSDKDGFKHIYLFDYSGKLINQVTSGKWDVNDVIGADEEAGRIFFTSNERGRRFKDLYSVSFHGKNKTRLTEQQGTHSIDLSPDSKYYIDRYSNANTPSSTYLMNINGQKIRNLAVSDPDLFREYNLAETEFFMIRTEDGVELDAFMLKPSDFDETKKYPVLITQYNGPGSQSVNDSWGTPGTWEKMLSQNGIVIIGVDSRITAGKGSAYKKYAHKNLGYWETFDLTETVKYLRKLKYTDPENIAVWGWSYGGYTSALALMKASDYFKAAIAVASVTDWRFYDNIYTERYMSTPALNPEGYYSSSVLNYTDNLKGNLLLIHGTADDNVHFQNSITLADKLIESNKQFRTMFYPGRDHGISGGNTREQLYEMMTEFLIESFSGLN